jgi:protocatechuate 4,5-dioxygenase beta chain
MGKIIAGIGVSHVPAIGAAVDSGRTDTGIWKRVFDGYAPVREYLAEARPDVAIVVYNDHGSAISLDVVPTFAIGVAPHFPTADEGRGPRPIAPVVGDPDLAWHLTDSLVADEFDITACQKLPADHGLTVPLSILWGTPQAWPVRIVPLAVNVIHDPLPTARRCFRLGQAIRRAVDAYPSDVKVVVIGTGGMSHQLQGDRAGKINPEFDQMFLDQVRLDPAALTRISTSEYADLAGSEGVELIMWLTMRGALSEDVALLHQDYVAPVSMSGAGIVVLHDA